MAKDGHRFIGRARLLLLRIDIVALAMRALKDALG